MGRKGKNQITLARAISKFGIASRVQARLLIREGRVTVNSRVVHSPDVWVDPTSDRITCKGKTLEQRTPLYFVMNKPAGIVTTRSDELGRKTVYDLLPPNTPWVFPVGRLDLESSGLLILTNDTRFGDRMTNPSAKIPKTYSVQLDKPLMFSDRTSLTSEFTLADGTVLLPAIVHSSGGDPRAWNITIFEGKNRQVRRMFKTLGYEVVALHRVSIGSLQIGQLPEGEVRRIMGEELRRLIPDVPSSKKKASAHRGRKTRT